MKVRIFKNIISEKNPSMEIYAQELLKNMPSNVDSFSIPAKNYPIFKYYITKEFIYPKIAAKNQADVNHISDHSYCGLLRALDPGKTVVTCHDLIPLIDTSSASLLGRKRFWYNIKLLPEAEKIIAISEFTRNTILDKFKEIKKDKVKVIPYGVSDIFKPIEQKDILRKKYNINKKSILHVGSFQRRKNVELILKILSKRKDWQFVKVGPFSKRQLCYIKENNLNEQIIHFAYIDLPEREKLAEIYNCVGALVFPSFCEGFGMPILEAFACGCPVVCSDIAPFVEIAKDAAIFFNPKDLNAFEESVEKTLEDKNVISSLVQNGLSISKNYSWKKCTMQTYKIYEEVNG